MTTSARAEVSLSAGAGRSVAASRRRRRWAMRGVQVVGRAMLDCAYLVRSRQTRRNKLRVLFEYVRMTMTLLLGGDRRGARSDRVLGYRVRHFGYASLHFLFREIFVRNDYFFETGAPRPLVVDCGANIGLATLFFKWLYPGCEVHAFEPDPETFALLKDNVERNGLADVHLHNVALCDRDGAVEFFVPQGGHGSLVMSLVPARMPEAERRRIVVDGRRLSTYLEGRDVDFLKMDVEGAERPVFTELARAGALPRVKEMVVEYHHNLEGTTAGFAGFLQLLQDSGYAYQLDATRGAAELAAEFQDVLVWACRPPAGGRATPAIRGGSDA